MIPSYETVPEHWKAPMGPYRQAPPDYGSKWYLVSPFTGPEPWLRDVPVEQPTYPEGFIEIFGERPRDRFERVEWEGRLDRYEADHFPTGTDISDAAATFEFWGLGRMLPYRDKTFGLMVGFPDAAIKGYAVPMELALRATHLAIAGYQIDLLQDGVEIDEDSRHPFVPPRLFRKED